MPRLSRHDLLSSLLTGVTAILVVAFACNYAAVKGGPAWLVGQELAIVARAALFTTTLVAIDICWKMRAA